MEKFPMRKDWIECGEEENLFVGAGGREKRISLEEKDVWSLLPALLSFEQQLPLPSVRYELALNIL